jgi:hypothetical protein
VVDHVHLEDCFFLADDDLRVTPRLQHAVEVAANPEVQGALGLDRPFKRLGTPSGCGATFSCSETEEAIDVEGTVDRELKAKGLLRR